MLKKIELVNIQKRLQADSSALVMCIKDDEKVKAW